MKLANAKLFQNSRLKIIFWVLALCGIGMLFPTINYFYPIYGLLDLSLLTDFPLYATLVIILLLLIGFIFILQIVRVGRPNFFKPKILKLFRWIRIPLGVVFVSISFFGVFAIGYTYHLDTWYRGNDYKSWTEKEPYLSWTGDSATTMTITWETRSPSDEILQYGPAADNLAHIISINNQDTQHRVNLVGLIPNTKYFYQVEGWDTIYSFKTAPMHMGHHSLATSATPFTFLSYGDNRYDSPLSWGPRAGTCNHDKIVDRIFENEGENYEFMINVGDVVMSGGDRTQWAKFYREINAHDMAATKPYMIALGNHEYYRTSKDGLTGDEVSHEYLSFDTMPGKSLQSLPSDEFNHWFNYSNALFINLNTRSSGSLASDAITWFNTTLEEHSANYDWVFVNFHYPIYSSAQSGNSNSTHLIENVEKAFFWANGTRRVDFCLTGHRHTYERLIKDGITHFVLGGGGASMDGWGTPYPDLTQKFDGDTQHYAKFEIIGKEVRYTAIDIDGNTLDNEVYAK